MDSQLRDQWQKARHVMSYTMPAAPLNFLSALTGLAMIILDWFKVTLVPFVRIPGTVGERYFSLLHLFLGYMALQSFTFMYSVFGILSGNLSDLAFLAYSGSLSTLFISSSGLIYHLYLYSFLLLSAVHLFTIWRRKRRGIRWHSMSDGISWLEYVPWQLLRLIPFVGKYIRVDALMISRFIEPGICYWAGTLLWQVEPLLGWWLIVSSVALGVSSNVSYVYMRGRVLDLMDAQIESDYLSSALGGAHKRETAGFSVVPVARQWLNEGPIDISASVQETLSSSEEKKDNLLEGGNHSTN